MQPLKLEMVGVRFAADFHAQALNSVRVVDVDPNSTILETVDSVFPGAFAQVRFHSTGEAKL